MTDREILRYAFKGVLNDITKYEEKCEKFDIEIERNLHMYKDYDEIRKMANKLEISLNAKENNNENKNIQRLQKS